MRKALVLLLVLACAGCAAIPTTGPVQVEPRQTSGAAPGGVQIIGNKPPQGASPGQIIQGFLAAMSSFEPGFETARSYLTAAAAQAWQPESQVLIYASGTTPRVNDDQVTMSAAMVGVIGPDGSFGAAGNSTWTFDFQLVQENGEWRISHPPAGLAMSQYMFSQAFSRVEAYFFADAGAIMVPDSRYVQLGAWDATAAARLVMDGPSGWLAPVIDSTFRQGLALAGDVSVDALGVARVPLAWTASLTTAQASRLALELAATMRGVPGVIRIQLTRNNAVVTLDPSVGALADSSMPVSATTVYDPTQPGAGGPLYVAAESGISALDGLTPAALGAPWGNATPGIVSFAVSRDGAQIAAETADGLVFGPVAGREPSLVLDRPDLLRPEFDASGQLWLMANGDDGAEVWAVVAGQVIELAATALAGRTVLSFAMSPDGRRLLVLSRPLGSGDDVPTQVGLALIRYDGQVPAEVTAWRQLDTTFQGMAVSAVADLAWMGPTSILLLGSTQAGRPPEIFSGDMEWLNVDEWGNPAEWTVQAVSANPGRNAQQVAVLDASGEVWIYQSSRNWTVTALRYLALAYPA